MSQDWQIYRQECAEPHNDIDNKLPPAPSWRDFTERKKNDTRGKSYQPSSQEVEIVNAALYLRRPILITGNPGTGKSSLAYAVAYQLGLGSVLWWPINSRSTLQDGLYSYDALARLRDLNIEKLQAETNRSNQSQTKHEPSPENIGRYFRLGPLGTALYGSSERPRVLLIDEIDKSDIDLPNDLLHVLEEGAFDIQELQRLTPAEVGLDSKSTDPDVDITVKVYPHQENRPSKMVPITNGHVPCNRFPFVVLTSNGERELPPAFRRRCLSLNIDDPKGKRLEQIIEAHLGNVTLQQPVKDLIRSFEDKHEQNAMIATDQLLNAIYLITRENKPDEGEWQRIVQTVLRELGYKN